MEHYELKACPMCGGEAVVAEYGYPEKVFCRKCGLRVEGEGFQEDGRKDAARKWNRRTGGGAWVDYSVQDPPLGKEVLAYLRTDDEEERMEILQIMYTGMEPAHDYSMNVMMQDGKERTFRWTHWMELPEMPED